MLQPPGSLLHYLMGGWPEAQQQELIQELSVSASHFQRLLAGAEPWREDQFSVISEATGVKAQTFSELEHEFSRWAGTVRPMDGYVNELLHDENIRERFTAVEISRRVAALALEMSGLPSSRLVMVPILKGAFIFSADLIRYLFNLEKNPFVDFLELSSKPTRHERTQEIVTSGALSPQAIQGNVVLIVDDICDTGVTLDTARQHAASMGATEVYTCVLFDRKEHRADHLLKFSPDFVGFTVSTSGWLVGYGMDDQGRFRGSADVGELLVQSP